MENTVLNNLTAETEASHATERMVRAERLRAGGRDVPLRVAHVLPWPGLGGVATAALRLALALEETGEFRSLAFCHGGLTRVGRMFKDAGIETIGYEAGELSYRHPVPFLRGSKHFFRLLKEHEIDIIHCADLQGAYHAGLASKLARVPLVCHIRSNFEDFPSQYKPPLKAVSHFVFVSNTVWRNFDTIYRVKPKRGTVIYDWGPQQLDEQSKAHARARVREEFQIEPDAPVIGMIARVEPPKDFETILRATSEVTKKHPRARLLFVGEYNHPNCFEHHQRLCALVKELKLSGHVIWAGLRQDVPDLIRAMDVFALSTHMEGLPLVILEAMAMGCPVVATRVGGIPELIAHEETGLLHERNDYQELARHISGLFDNATLAARLGRRGQEHVRANFNQEKTINATRNLYARLTNRKTLPLAANIRSL